jgi:hypothetical protein
MDAKDELKNLLSKLNADGKISMQGYVDILTKGLGIILPDILTQLKALTERVDELGQRELDDRIAIGIASDKIIKIEDSLSGRKKTKMPPTGPVKFGPVLNDGKASSNPGGQLPFVTGLSVKPNPDRQCSFCGAEHEYRNMYHTDVDNSICRGCIADAVEWKEANHETKPKIE